MSESELNNGPTILDYLDGDCWQILLDYVPLLDIIRSERVSQQWQNVVLMYLRRVRISIEHPRLNISGKLVKVRKWTPTNHKVYRGLISKLGPSVVGCFCASETRMQMVGENCPNLEAVMFKNLNGKVLEKNLHENYKWLRRVCFKGLRFVKDSHVAQFLSHSRIRELEFIINGWITGQFLTKMKSKYLKSLIFEDCYVLNSGHFLATAAANRFSELTVFEITGAPKEVYENIHLVLEKMPKLEHLQMCHYENIRNDEFFNRIGELKNLRYLFANFEVTNENLEVVVRSCKALQFLRLTSCTAVTGRGLVAACSVASARLSMLGVYGSDYLTDEHVAACLRVCPSLATCQI